MSLATPANRLMHYHHLQRSNITVGATCGMAMLQCVSGSCTVCCLMAHGVMRVACRFVFWRQMVGRQQQQSLRHGCTDNSSSSNKVAAQLHELARSSLLQQQPKLQRHAVGDAKTASKLPVPAGAALAAATGSPHSVRLQAKLQQYMQAHVQWRQQQLCAEPLLPAEKWPTLEHEEQVGVVVWLFGSSTAITCTSMWVSMFILRRGHVHLSASADATCCQCNMLCAVGLQVLDFITSLTISVYHSLLRKHRGMPAAPPVQVSATAGLASAPAASKRVTAFGSSSTRSTAADSTAAGAARGAAKAAAGAAVAGVRAQGQALPAVPKIARTVPREAKRHAAHVFVIPSPPHGDAATSATAAMQGLRCSWQQQQQQGVVEDSKLLCGRQRKAELAAADAERLEAWQGWRTATGTPEHGSTRAASGSSAEGCSVASAGGCAAGSAAAGAEVGADDGLGSSGTSCCSSASSWQLHTT